MASKFLSTALLSFVGIATLPAQNLVTELRHTGANDSTLGHLVSQLTQNALTALLGMVALMGIAWMFCIWNACAQMKNKQKNAGTPSLFVLLCVAAGLSMFGSSCTAAQQAQAADIQAARAAERGYCVCPATFDNRNDDANSGMNNRFTHYNHSSDIGRPFCRQCGQRIYYRNR